MISVGEIEQDLRKDVKKFAPKILPNGKVEGPYFKVGSVRGEAGSSLVLHLQGHHQGEWFDNADSTSGDMIDLIAAARGCRTKGEAIAEAKAMLGIKDEWNGGRPAPVDPAEMARRAEASRVAAVAQADAEAKDLEARIGGAKALFLKGVPIANTPAARYLEARGIEVARLGAWPGSLRFYDQVWNRECNVKMPAMLAMMVNAQGAQTGTHITYLDRDARGQWVKASETGCGVSKKMCKITRGAMRGSFIPLRKGASGKSMRHVIADEPVWMTEGIEDALTIAMARPDVRLITGMNLRNLGRVILPDVLRTVTILADRDEDPREMAAFEGAIAKQQASGLNVNYIFPPVGQKDFNGWLMAMLRADLKKGLAA